MNAIDIGAIQWDAKTATPPVLETLTAAGIRTGRVLVTAEAPAMNSVESSRIAFLRSNFKSAFGWVVSALNRESGMSDDLERQALIVFRDAEKLMKRWMDGLEKSSPFVGRYSEGYLKLVAPALLKRMTDVINELWYDFDCSEQQVEFETEKFKMMIRLMREGARPGDDPFVPEKPSPVFTPREKSESPIEQAMFKALRSFGWLCVDPGKIGEDFQHDPLKRGIYIYQQAPILGYRADFLLGAMASADATPHWVVVECDGHEFHERTAEQAEHDRARDRAMTAAGYRVFRFTGREIRRDAARCAAEVLRYLRPFAGGEQ